MAKHSVLFVCLGNICRSPAAEGMLHHFAEKKGLSQDLYIDSCGLGDWHVGALPDSRMQKAAQDRGVQLVGRARQFKEEDLHIFDFILVVDREVMNALYRFAKTTEHKSKIKMITDFSVTYAGKDIPDPYYGGQEAFELVLDMLEESCEGLLFHLYKK